MEILLPHLLTFVLILSRVGGLLATAPVLGARSVPMRVRGFLAVLLAALATPSQLGTTELPANLLDLTLAAARETTLGISLGLGVQVLFTGVHVAGQLAGQLSGTQLAEAFDPTFDGSVPVFGQLLDMLVLAAFVAIGGPGRVLGALLDTFAWRPPGGAPPHEHFARTLVDITSQSLALGLRAGAPIMVSMLLAVLVLGLISRTLPQLNVMAVGFSFNAMAMIVTLYLTLGAVTWVFQEEAVAVLDVVREAFTPGDPADPRATLPRSPSESSY